MGPGTTLTRGLVLVLAVTAGACVANLYYAQPLLEEIGAAMGVRTSTAAIIITASQVGYAAGLLLLVPLGDLLERRRLLVTLLGCAAVASLASALAGSLAVLALTTVAVGTMSVAAQVIVPLAGDLAADHERGRVVGTVVSGLLIGILTARTISGFVAEALGWRAVFALGAAIMLVLTATLALRLPAQPPRAPSGYGRLLRSILTLVREEPLLRRRMLYGALGMFSFSVLWTGLTLLLSAPPYGYNEAVIGLFGLAGLAGAAAAQGAGRSVDAGHTRAATLGLWMLVLASWGVVALVGHGIVLLVVRLILFDAGMQGAMVTNQGVIYALRPDARSRLNAAYVGSVFAGGGAGSLLAPLVWDAGGWDLVCALGALPGVLAVALWTWEDRPR